MLPKSARKEARFCGSPGDLRRYGACLAKVDPVRPRFSLVVLSDLPLQTASDYLIVLLDGGLQKVGFLEAQATHAGAWPTPAIATRTYCFPLRE